jgi:hypothetical protein
LFRSFIGAYLLAASAVLIGTNEGRTDGVASGPRSTLPVLVRRVIERGSKITALSAVYSEIAEDGSFPSAGLRRHVAASRDPCLFFRDNAHWSGRLSWQDDALRKLTYLNSARLVFYRPSDESVFINQAGELPDVISNEFLFHALIWWPFDRKWTPKVQGVPWNAEAIFESHQCLVGNTAEQRENCKVTPVDVKDVGTFWIAPDRGAAIMGWIIRDPKSGYDVEQIELGGWRRCRDDLWMPTTIRNIQRDFRASRPELRRRTVVDTRFRIDELKVNEDVDRAVFTFNAPTGTVRMEETAGKVKVVDVYPNERDFAERLLKWMVRIGFTEGSEGLPFQSVVVGIGIGSAALGAFCTMVALRLWKGLSLGNRDLPTENTRNEIPPV